MLRIKTKKVEDSFETHYKRVKRKEKLYKSIEKMGGGESTSSGSDKKSGSMTKSAASRIQSAGARNPESATHQSGFDSRAQSAVDKNAKR